MIVYLFWHWAERPEGYEEGLVEFHRRLAGGRVPGLVANATYRVLRFDAGHGSLVVEESIRHTAVEIAFARECVGSP